MDQLTVAGILMGGTGLVLGAVIGVFAKVFKVSTDPRIALVTELLPGANCGGCGKAGCADFAKSVVAGENPPGKCPVSSKEQIAAIAMALGVETGSAFPRRAVVRCGGDKGQVTRQVNYNGVADCASAALIAGGPKGCSFGCLGLGSCARKCPFGAIEIINNLAVVHEELCVGCGNCVAACPRNVIALVPAAATAHVYCNSPAKGAEKRRVCRVGCIGCRKCEKYAPEKFSIKGFLASVDYEAEALPGGDDIRNIGCPTDALLTAERHLFIEKNCPEGAEK